MNGCEPGEGAGVVATEVPEQVGVVGQPEGRPGQFDGQQPGIGRGGRRPASADLGRARGGEFVVDRSEQVKDQVVFGHGGFHPESTTGRTRT